MRIPQLSQEMIDYLRAWFHPKDRHIYLSDEQWIISQKVAWETAVSKFQALPGLVGFWPMSSVQRSTGNAYDLSNQSRHLVYNGNPVYSLYNQVVPYLALDGTSDFLSRTDETDLDILGTETIYASGMRGLTLGGWFWQDNLTGTHTVMGKFVAAGDQRSYALSSIAGVITLSLSSGGTAGTTVSYTGSAVAAGKWFFAVGRWKPNATADIFVSGTKTSNASAIASIFNSTAPLRVGDRGDGAALLTGRASLCFLCANALPDSLISMLFEQSRKLFGVGF